MRNLVLLSVGTVVLMWFSRKPLRNPGAHGYYRFFAWEAILGLLVMNHRVWGQRPLSVPQMVSWPLMLLSILLVQQGLTLLQRYGGASQTRVDGSLYKFEKTTSLVERGVFSYIRHPMYASLLALAWGAFFQDPSPVGGILVVTASMFLMLTAKADERECVRHFGPEYLTYMKRTKMFIPGIY